MSNGTPNWPPPPTAKSLQEHKKRMVLENHPDATIDLSDDERKSREKHFIKEMKEIKDTEAWLGSEESEVAPEVLTITKQGTALAEVRNRLNITPKEEGVSASVPVVPETLQEEPAPEEQVRSANLEFVEVVQTNQEAGPERRNEALRITHESTPTPEEGTPVQDEELLLQDPVPTAVVAPVGQGGSHGGGGKGFFGRAFGFIKLMGRFIRGVFGTIAHYAGHAFKHKPEFDMGSVAEVVNISVSGRNHKGGGSHGNKEKPKGGGGAHH